mmetsp:Transcript_14973/g.23178  ORF Transcript_14973/g.23178 Transcript_14973/m.23178 type:complete len:80 (+) Transcript_14973:5981-6220(+)
MQLNFEDYRKISAMGYEDRFSLQIKNLSFVRSEWTLQGIDSAQLHNRFEVELPPIQPKDEKLDHFYLFLKYYQFLVISL